MKIFGGLDDIQILLDDHLVKCQALRASPYMAAFADLFKVNISLRGSIQTSILSNASLNLPFWNHVHLVQLDFHAKE